MGAVLLTLPSAMHERPHSLTVCVCEREREGGRERKSERARERKRERKRGGLNLKVLIVFK